MAPNGLRRSRAIESEEEEESRPSTPLSTAPNDGKRARRNERESTDPSTPESEDIVTTQENRQHRSSNDRALNFGISKMRPAHQPGAIVRVKLTNFVTYTSAEFYPGPNLNMVIGPNGTGKSTLVCAICLGLGWGTQYLGRAKDVAEYVKHGCREATIEIELQRATQGRAKSKANPIITRTIKREGNKSTFTLNGSQTSNKAIIGLAQSFDIQIDNLCQFLPQDKVVEFAQMTPIQILESTQRAAAPPEMLEYHQNLKTLREKQKDFINNGKGDREQLTNLENRQEAQRTEVERLRERAIIQKRLEWLEKCRPIPQYSEARSQKSMAKERKLVLGKALKRLQDESAPNLQKVNAKQTYAKQVKNMRDQQKQNVKRAEQECDRMDREIQKHVDALKDLGSQHDAEAKSKPKHKREIARLTGIVATLKNLQKTPPEQFDSRAANQEIADLNSRKRELVEEQESTMGIARPLADQYKDRQNLMKELADKEAKLQTIEGQLQGKLQHASADTHKAWEWIKQNQHMFQKTVYGPPLTECSVKDASLASVVEAALPPGEFKVITAQCADDFHLLQEQLITKQRLHDISLRQCRLDSLESFSRPFDQTRMEEHGVNSWVIDLLEGPPTILAMLCQERGLHQMAIAARDVSEEQYEKLQNSIVKGYITKNVGYTFIRRSEYGKAGNSARDINMRPKGFWTGQSGDGGQLAELRNRRAETEGEMEIIRGQLTPMKSRLGQIRSELDKIEEDLKKVKNDKDEKQKALTEYNGLETKLNNNESKIASTQNLVDDLDRRLIELQSKKDETMFEQAEAALQYAGSVHKLQIEMQQLLEAEVMLIEAENDVQVLRARNQEIVDLLAQKNREFDEAEKKLKQADQEARILVNKIKQVRDEGLKLEKDTNDEGLSDTLSEISQISQAQNFTEKDLDDMIGVEQAKLELTEGGDSNAIKEFEERAKKIERLRSKLVELAAEQETYTNGIREVRSHWEPELEALVAKISDAFGDSFARIGCAGQVAVYKASSEDPADCTEDMGGVDNGLDFANWAIHISVKFRENEPLSLLDSHRQSGGERAVSTIFYLMALQSLSRAPFRVVDEINQGMDPRNERMVHGRMVDIAAADENGNGQGSQYFLITPKLLSGLKYKSGMTVLCIVSGENMPNAGDVRRRDESGKVVVQPGRKIDFEAFAKRARELGMDQTTAQRGGRSGASFTNSFGSLGRSRATEVGA